MSRIKVALNEHGYRIGESHQRARHSEQTVDKIRIMHETHGYGYRKISAMLGIGRSTVQKVCKYLIRGQAPHEYRVIDG